ncbi:MAG: T9SS type A sorting domain-containing protein [bacterium]
MKKILILFIVFGLPFIANAQVTIERSIINTGGGSYSATDFELSYSIGEPIVETAIIPTVILTQGFQQPNETGGDDVILTEPGFTVKVYPNPMTHKLSIEESDETQSNSTCYYLSLVNLEGDKILNELMITDKIHVMDFSNYANGGYYLIIKKDDVVKKIKVVKMD